jgi:peptidoglycan/LPS O-acetylase OafA/YrhL
MSQLDPPPSTPTSGAYQPGLDGLRAVSVAAVLVYHAGFSWLHGGFLGVEVFFVVSGFLITSLLVAEIDRTGRVSLRSFWARRARRLLPALVLVLVAVALGAALFGGPTMHADVRRDLPWAVFYAANWGQIIGDAAYFANLSPLRHLWSLAVEEQWYLLWPLVVAAIVAVARRAPRRVAGSVAGSVVVGCSVAVMAFTAWLARAPELGTERIDLLYLSTFTRASGLLLGAGVAMIWTPWRTSSVPGANRRSVGGVVDVVGAVAAVVLAQAMIEAAITDRALYRWQLAAVSVASLTLVVVAVHPASRVLRPVLSWPPLVAVGKRSYGIYLWSWPISVAVGATSGRWGPFATAMVCTVVVAEVSYRFVETPIRDGRLGRWWRRHRTLERGAHLGGGRRHRVAAVAVCLGALAVAVPTTAFYARVEPTDVLEGGDAAFDLGALDVLPVDAGDPTLDAEPVAATSTSAVSPESEASPGSTSDPAAVVGFGSASSIPSVASNDVASNDVASNDVASNEVASAEVAATTTTVPPPPTTAASLPRRVVVVGDSTARALAINAPRGIGEVFDIADGGVDGCSVYGDGKVQSARRFGRSFTDCATATDQWRRDAERSDAEIALVVLGAWDVFDQVVDGWYLAFGSPAADARFVAGVQLGIDGLVASGVHVSLLEIACMRPVDAEGAAVPALPERGDDARIAHLNELLRAIAADQPDTVTFVPGPTQWCGDDAVSSDRSMRWDGVHVYQPGAKLIWETIATSLLTIPL